MKVQLQARILLLALETCLEPRLLTLCRFQTLVSQSLCTKKSAASILDLSSLTTSVTQLTLVDDRYLQALETRIQIMAEYKI